MLGFLPAAIPSGLYHNLPSATSREAHTALQQTKLPTGEGFDFQRAGFDLFQSPRPTPQESLAHRTRVAGKSKHIWFLRDESAFTGARPLTPADFPRGVNSLGILGAGPLPPAGAQACKEFRRVGPLSFETWFALGQSADQE